MECTGDRREKVVHVLKYMGRHGGSIKSCESSSLRQGTLDKYSSPVSRTIDGQSVRVEMGYDTCARVLHAADIEFKMTITRVAFCPEPKDLGRCNDAYVAPGRFWRNINVVVVHLKDNRTGGRSNMT